MTRGLRSLALAAAVAASSALARAEEPAQEPEICRAALEEHAGREPLAALQLAEEGRWRIAKRASRRAKKLMRESIGLDGSHRSMEIAMEVDQLDVEFTAAVRDARTICTCREERGDPHREDCAALYRRWLPEKN